MAERMLPQSPEAKTYRIQALLRAVRLSEEQVADLVERAEALVKSLPNDSSAHLVRAMAVARTGDVDSALQRLEQSVAMLDDAADVLIAVARYHVRNHDVQRAVELMQRQIARQPQTADWRIALAEFQERAGRIAEARDTLTQAEQEVGETGRSEIEFAIAEFMIRSASTA